MHHKHIKIGYHRNIILYFDQLITTFPAQSIEIYKQASNNKYEPSNEVDIPLQAEHVHIV